MKNKLIAESLSLFEKNGFSETSIQEIVEACGVTKGTFYYYFNSKQELLYKIQLDYINEVLVVQDEIIKSSSTNQTKLELMIAELIKKIKTDGANARIFFREMRHLPKEELQEILQKRDAIRFKLQSIISEGMKSREFREDLQLDFVTFAILGMCNWSYSWFDPNGPETEETLIKSYVDVLLHGLVAKNEVCETS